MNNLIIRTTMLKNGYRAWMLANLLKISEPTLYRKLRVELPEDEQRRIAELIEEDVAKGDQKHE